MSFRVKSNFEFKNKKTWIIIRICIDAGGDYYRLLIDGTYAIKIESLGYKNAIEYVNITNQARQIHAKRLDFILQRSISKPRVFKEYFQKFRIWF